MQLRTPITALAAVAVLVIAVSSISSTAVSQPQLEPRSEVILASFTALSTNALAGPGLIRSAPGTSGILYQEAINNGENECVSVSNFGDCTIVVATGTGTPQLVVPPNSSGSFHVDTWNSSGKDLSWQFQNNGSFGLAVWVVRQGQLP